VGEVALLDHVLRVRARRAEQPDVESDGGMPVLGAHLVHGDEEQPFGRRRLQARRGGHGRLDEHDRDRREHRRRHPPHAQDGADREAEQAEREPEREPEPREGQGIVWAVDHGARVVNLSLGGPETTQSLTDAIAYAAGKGAVVVGAAGNNGTSTPFYPAADPNAIGVAGSTATDQLYPWSNFGTWVNVAAPGCNIAPVLAGGYGPFCGTSSATPVVAGLAALVVSVDPGTGVTAVRQALARSAVPLPGAVQYGRIDASRTLESFRPASVARTSVVLRGTVGGRVHARTFRLTVASGELHATLTFKGTRTLKLSLVPPVGRPFVRNAVTSPLRLRRSVADGTIELVVAGAKKRTSFALAVSYVRPGR
jgi:Subtilase family